MHGHVQPLLQQRPVATCRQLSGPNQRGTGLDSVQFQLMSRSIMMHPRLSDDHKEQLVLSSFSIRLLAAAGHC